MNKNAEIEVIVGTYEELLVGYRVVKREQKYDLEQSFVNHSHCGSIRAVACQAKCLASGSTDETIKLFDLKSRIEIGGIIEHEGSINCLQFYGNSHLFSASDDKNICIWKTKSWDCLRTLNGHKAGILSMSVHPSGKLALSVSNDQTLKTWDLVKGYVAFSIKLNAVSNIIQWSPSGGVYAVVIGNKVNFYNVAKACICHSIDFGCKISAIVFITDDIVALGGEGENVEFHAANKAAILCILPTKTNRFHIRVKALACIVSPDLNEERWLVSSSSDGFIKIWKLNLTNLSSEQPSLVTEVGTGCRITCQVVVTGRQDVAADEVITDEKATAAPSTKKRKLKKQNGAVKKKKKKVEFQGKKMMIE